MKRLLLSMLILAAQVLILIGTVGAFVTLLVMLYIPLQ